MIKRGEVYWVRFDPTVGAEIRKTRPAVVVSNDINNLHARTVTVLPLTSSVENVSRYEVFFKPNTFGNKKACKAKANHIRAVDKGRLGDLMGLLPDFLMAEVDQAMRLHLAL